MVPHTLNTRYHDTHLRKTFQAHQVRARCYHRQSLPLAALSTVRAAVERSVHLPQRMLRRHVRPTLRGHGRVPQLLRQ